MNILVMSNSVSVGPVETRYSYAIIAYEVSKALQNAGHKIFYLEMHSPCHQPYLDENGITRLGIRYNVWGRDTAENYIKMYKIDCLFTMFDIWMDTVAYIPDLIKKYNLLWVHHATLNSEPLSPILFQRMQNCAKIISPSKYGLNLLQSAGITNGVYIPHGTRGFYPADASDTKKDLKLQNTEFIALSVMRNKEGQKLFDVLFEGWKYFLDECPEMRGKAKLLCLTDPFEPQGVNLTVIRAMLGLDADIQFVWVKPGENANFKPTYEGDPNGMIHNANMAFSVKEMNKIYNCTDVHVLSSAGESFSLPNVESMACGKPCIMPNCTTGPELIGNPGTGLLYDISAKMMNSIFSKLFYGDPHSLAKSFKKLCHDPRFRTDCGQKGIKFVNENFTWDKILPQWVDLFDGIEKELFVVDYATGKYGI